MAIVVKVGTSTSPTSTGNQNIAHGLGATPDLVFFWGSARIDSDSFGSGYRFSYGAAVSSSARGWVGAVVPNGSTQSEHRQSVAKCFGLIANGGLLLCEADFVSADSTNFTINWSTVFTSGVEFQWMAISGVDANVFNFNLNSSTGSQNVAHGLGATPKLFICFGALAGTSGSGNQNNLRHNIGFATASNQFSQSAFVLREPAVSEDYSYFSASLVHNQCDSDGTLLSSAAFTSMDGTNVTLDVQTVEGGAQKQLIGVAIGGDIQVKIGTDTQRTSTGTKATSGVGFQPIGMLLASAGGTAAGAVQHARHTLGIASSTTNRVAVSAVAADNITGTTNHPGGRKTRTTKTIIFLDPTNTTTFAELKSEADLSSFDSDGFTLNWTTADATARQFGYVVWADAAGALTPAELTHAVALDNTTLTQTHQLTAQELTHSVALDNTTINVGTITLTPQDLTQTVGLDNTTISHVRPTTITWVESGAIGRYIDMGSPAVLDNLGSMTVLVYWKPTGTGENGFGYAYAKTPSGSVNGTRFFSNHNSNNPTLNFGSSSTGSAGNPQKQAPNNAITYNSWQHDAFTWDGGLAHANVHLYTGIGVDLAEVGSYTVETDGTTAIYDDSAEPVFLLNRQGLGRAHVGPCAYIAVWDHVLSLTELRNAQNGGPLNQPTGLVLLWTNQQDYSTNLLVPSARSTFVHANELPPNTALGGDLASTELIHTVALDNATLTQVHALTAQELLHAVALDNTTLTLTGALEVADLLHAVALDNATLTQVHALTAQELLQNALLDTTGTISLEVNFEGASIVLSGSSITNWTSPSANPTITIKPMLQESEAYSSQSRWLAPRWRQRGLNGLRPTFVLTDYAATPADGTYHGAPWQSGRRMVYSYSPGAGGLGLATWNVFDTNHTIGASTITWQHSQAFNQDEVTFAWARTFTISDAGTWINLLESTYPTLIHNLPSNTSGFQSGTYTSQTNPVGKQSGSLPLYAFKIANNSLSRPSGKAKYAIVLTFMNHGGEDLGDLVGKLMVEYLLGTSDAWTTKMLTYCEFYCYVGINSPGRYLGGMRGSYTQGPGGIDDANRNFTGTTPNKGLEIVDIPMTAMQADLPATVLMSIDFHGNFGGRMGIFTAAAAHDVFLSALQTYAPEAVGDLGTGATGDIEQWFADNYGAIYYITSETGEPTPISDADLDDWARAHVQAAADLLPLEIFDLQHAVALDNATLTQTHALTSADVLHLVTLDGATLSQAHAVTVQDLLHTVALDNTTLTQVHSLVSVELLQAVLLDNAALTQTHTLTAQELAQAVALDSATLDLSVQLTSQDLLQAVLLDNATLTQNHALAVAELLHAIALDGVVVTQTHVLTSDDLLQAVLLDNATLTLGQVLVPADLLHAIALDNATLTQAHLLTSQELLHAVSLDTATLVGGQLLEVADLLHAVTLENATLLQDHVLAVAELLQAAALDAATLTQIHSLVSVELLHTVALDGTTVTQDHVLTAAELAHAVTLDTATLTQEHVLVSVDLLQTVSLDNATVGAQDHLLTPDDLLQAAALDNATLTQVHQLTTAELLQATSLGNSTLSLFDLLLRAQTPMIVSVDDSTIIVGSEDYVIVASPDNTN